MGCKIMVHGMIKLVKSKKKAFVARLFLIKMLKEFISFSSNFAHIHREKASNGLNLMK